MIIEIFIVGLLALKTLGLIDLSWTITCVIALALLAVSVQLHLNKKALLNGMLKGSEIIADKLDDIEFRLESKEDRRYDDD